VESVQACEFDYSGAQACKALREEGYRVISFVNSNPQLLLDRPRYGRCEPYNRAKFIGGSLVTHIIAKERPDAVLLRMEANCTKLCALT